MPIRVRDATPEDGGIVAPDDVMQSLAVLIDEFNGSLDADNLPEKGITASMVASGAFAKIVPDQATAAVDFEGETTAWRATNNSGTGINTQTVTPDADALLEVEWSATWDRGSTSSETDLVAFRILVDGSEVARMPLSPGIRKHDSTYLHGEAQVTAGECVVTVEIKQWASGSDETTEETVTINERELLTTINKR